MKIINEILEINKNLFIKRQILGLIVFNFIMIYFFPFSLLPFLFDYVFKN